MWLVAVTIHRHHHHLVLLARLQTADVDEVVVVVVGLGRQPRVVTCRRSSHVTSFNERTQPMEMHAQSVCVNPLYKLTTLQTRFTTTPLQRPTPHYVWFF